MLHWQNVATYPHRRRVSRTQVVVDVAVLNFAFVIGECVRSQFSFAPVLQPNVFPVRL